MAAHPTLRRAIVAALCALIAVAVAVAAAAAPGAALAARGDGPYTPFPDRPDSRAQDYVNRLNERSTGLGGAGVVAPEQLAKGVVTPAGEDASGGRGGEGGRGGRGRSAKRSEEGVGPAASPFSRAGFSPASPPPDSSATPFLALGGLLGLAAVGVGVYRVRRRWAA